MNTSDTTPGNTTVIIYLIFIRQFFYVIYIIYLIVMDTYCILNGIKNSFKPQNKPPFLCAWLWRRAVLCCLEFYIINKIKNIATLVAQVGVIVLIKYCLIIKCKEIVT